MVHSVDHFVMVLVQHLPMDVLDQLVQVESLASSDAPGVPCHGSAFEFPVEVPQPLQLCRAKKVSPGRGDSLHQQRLYLEIQVENPHQPSGIVEEFPETQMETAMQFATEVVRHHRTLGGRP